MCPKNGRKWKVKIFFPVHVQFSGRTPRCQRGGRGVSTLHVLHMCQSPRGRWRLPSKQVYHREFESHLALQSSVPEWLGTALEKQGGVTAYRVRFSGARPIYSISSEVEHLTFNQGVLGALPKWSTIYPISLMDRAFGYEPKDRVSITLWGTIMQPQFIQLERRSDKAEVRGAQPRGCTIYQRSLNLGGTGA